jgi:hypothetical protein
MNRHSRMYETLQAMRNRDVYASASVRGVNPPEKLVRFWAHRLRARALDVAMIQLLKDRALAILDGDSGKIGTAESAIILLQGVR